MAKARRRKAAKRKETKVKFFGHEVVLTFLGSLIISLGVMLAFTGLKPSVILWLFSTVIIWLGLLIFLFPIVRKIEGLM